MMEEHCRQGQTLSTRVIREETGNHKLDTKYDSMEEMLDVDMIAYCSSHGELCMELLCKRSGLVSREKLSPILNAY
jgi:hypothetical protein